MRSPFIHVVAVDQACIWTRYYATDLETGIRAHFQIPTHDARPERFAELRAEAIRCLARSLGRAAPPLKPAAPPAH